MKYAVNFYAELDSLNKIFFWGIIIIIISLIIIAILLINRANKLKKRTNNDEEANDDLAIKDLPRLSLKEETKQSEEILHDNTNNVLYPMKQEQKFIAEEHVAKYNNNLFSLNNIKKVSEIQTENVDEKTQVKKPNSSFLTKPYQKNVLREMASNQTSPIGIIKNMPDKTYDAAKELYESLEIQDEPELKKNIQQNNINVEKNITPEWEKATIPNEDLKKENIINKFEENKKELLNNDKRHLNQEKHCDNYLEEVSKKLASAEEKNDIERTEYEIKQEEEAIISYEELMSKKNEIKEIEEEAIISIEELMQKKEKEKLYNLSEKENNEEFIKELKDFRKEL